MTNEVAYLIIAISVLADLIVIIPFFYKVKKYGSHGSENGKEILGLLVLTLGFIFSTITFLWTLNHVVSFIHLINSGISIEKSCEQIAKDYPEDRECAKLAYAFDKNCVIPGEFITLAQDKHHAIEQFCLWLHFEAQKHNQ